jgi:hypothetical protein
VLHEEQSREQERQGLLEPVFQDGKMLRVESFTAIRERLQETLAP